jgi:hypothetical protein
VLAAEMRRHVLEVLGDQEVVRSLGPGLMATAGLDANAVGAGDDQVVIPNRTGLAIAATNDNQRACKAGGHNEE